MEIIATRKKEIDTSYVLVRNIILAVFAFLMGGLAFFGSDPSLLPVAISGSAFYLLGILSIALGIKNFKFNKRINKLPDEALCKHYNKLIIYNEEELTININDIKEIKCRRYIKTSFGLAQYISREGVLKIKTNDKLYKLENVEDVKKVHKFLIDWIKKDS